MDVFGFIDSINEQNYTPPDDDDREYNQFVINKGLSYFPDTILFVDLVNVQGYTNRMHYDVLYNLIGKRKRRSKWFKPEKEEFLDMIASYYSVNYTKAREYLRILTEEEIARIQEITNTGG